MSKDLQVIGRTAIISLPKYGIDSLNAKVDTGADGSSIWATKISEKDGVLSFCLLGPSSSLYTGQPIVTKDYKLIKVINSFGHKEDRYKVALQVEVEGRKIEAKFTLANRQSKSYPALIGRRLLNKRFLVDVSKNKPRST